MIGSNTVRALLALFLVVESCCAMGFDAARAQFHLAELHDDRLPLGNLGTPTQGHEAHLPIYHAAPYNEWIDGLLAHFSTNQRINASDGASIFLSAGRAIVHKLEDRDTDSELFAATKVLCSRPTSQYSSFLNLLRTKNTCLTDLEDNLLWVASSTARRQDLSVKDQVSSQLVCKVLSPALSCHEPVLAYMVECVSDGGAVRDAVASLESLLRGYCANEASNIKRNLMQGPPECVSEGVNFFLKYTGPDFLQHLTALDYGSYPCLYTKYMLSVADVILRKYCSATTLLDNLAEIEAEFSAKAGCADTIKI